MRGIVKFIQSIFTPVTQDQKRLTLISDLLQEKVVLREQVRNTTLKLKEICQAAESWQRKYQEVKAEISILRKRKSYYKKRCAFLEIDLLKMKGSKSVDNGLESE